MRKNSYLIVFVILLVAVFAYLVVALAVDTGTSNVALISPATYNNLSGNHLLNVTAPHISAGDGNITNATLFFWNFSNSSDPFVYNVTIYPNDASDNLSLNLTLNTSTFLPDGVYNVSINATNASDDAVLENSSVFTVVEFFVVDNTPPHVLSVTDGFEDRKNFTSTAGLDVIPFNVTVENASAVDDDNVSGIHVVQFNVSNGTGIWLNFTANAENGTSFNYTINLTTLGLVDGNHTMVVYANDTAGNTNWTQNITYLIDREAPGNVSLVSPDNAATVETTPTLRWEVNDSVATTLLCEIIIDDNVNVTGLAAVNGTRVEYNITSALADGAHNWSVSCNDTVELNNVSLSRNFTADGAAPSISESGSSGITSSGATISVTTNEAATCKFDTSSSASYDNMANGMDGAESTTHSKGIGGLSSSTKYTYYVKCLDAYNNAMTTGTSISFTTSSSGSSGGSGGGSSSGSAGQFEKKTWTSVFAGETATVEVDNGAIGVTEVSFSVDEDAYGLWVKIDKEESFPSTVPAFSGEVYRKLEITKNSGTKVDLQDIVVEFKVAEEWLSSKGFGNGDVALFRHVDGEWVELETEQTGEKDGYVHYASSTPGFSYFVIGEKTSAAVADTPETSDSAAEQPDKDSEEVEGVQEGLADALASTSGGAPNWVWIVVAVIVVAGIIIWFFNNRKK